MEPSPLHPPVPRTQSPAAPRGGGLSGAWEALSCGKQGPPRSWALGLSGRWQRLLSVGPDPGQPLKTGSGAGRTRGSSPSSAAGGPFRGAPCGNRGAELGSLLPQDRRGRTVAVVCSDLQSLVSREAEGRAWELLWAGRVLCPCPSAWDSSVGQARVAAPHLAAGRTSSQFWSEIWWGRGCTVPRADAYGGKWQPLSLPLALRGCDLSLQLGGCPLHPVRAGLPAQPPPPPPRYNPASGPLAMQMVCV